MHPPTAILRRFTVLCMLLMLLPISSSCYDDSDDITPSPSPEIPQEPILVVDPADIDFGRVLIDTTAEATFTLLNAGTSDLFIGKAELQVSGGGVYNLVEPLSGVTVHPGASVTLLVTFSPLAETIYGGAMLIESNDEDNPTLTVSITGEGTYGTDEDGDGSPVELGDCDDADPTTYPDADELCDGKDNDCDDIVDEVEDGDGDGYTPCDDPADCNDHDATTYPGADEICDGKDNDCDGEVDEGHDGDGDGTPDCTDEDSDGYSEDDGDCDDTDPSVHPDAAELCDGIDNNCNGEVDEGYDEDGDGTPDCTDEDGDGYSEDDGDCDDTNIGTHPGADEQCNLVDDDCDGEVDEGTDLDQDKDTYSICDGDCDDENPAVHPNAPELCNGIDDDCNGAPDDGLPTSVWYADADHDTYGNSGAATTSCAQPAGTVSDGTDCNDALASVNPGATEVCNSIDDDCDGAVDEDVLSTFYLDNDGDTYGTPSTFVKACTQPSGYVADKTDCNDAAASIHPGATEVCNDLDDDCDTLIDEGVATSTWYKDNDGDGYGTPDVSMVDCAKPVGFVADKTDCNDAVASIHPGAAEVCNAVDDDCDGSIDEGVTTNYYPDADKDGYGKQGSSPTAACSAPAGYVTNATDCDDAVQSTNPGATEQCNDVDDDCDGQIDDGVVNQTFYLDSDKDGYGDPAKGVTDCIAPTGYVTNKGDCNDANAAINPAATEVCNGVDDDCDGVVDDGVTTNYYPDGDKDGYGKAGSTPKAACSAPSGYVANSTDCDDANPAVNPAAVEKCNLVDDDCDGSIDEGFGDCDDSDDDGDGWTENQGDCNDNDQSITPILVNGAYVGSEDGSLSKPFNTIQEGINAAGTLCPLVLVKPYTYNERIDFKGKAITVKSTDGAASTVIDGQGGGSVVSFKNSENASAVLEAFTITNGLAPYGGGIYINSASPTIRNNLVLSNDCSGGGAGAYVTKGAPSFTGNTFRDNVGPTDSTNPSASAGGGILLSSNAPAVISGNIFDANRHLSGGGVALISAGAAQILNNDFTGNDAADTGGSLATGGAIYVFASSPSIEDNGFSGNSSTNAGGAIYLIATSAAADTSPTIDGNDFDGNTAGNVGSSTDAKGLGGAIFVTKSAPLITNNTFDGNMASIYGGAVYVKSGSDVELVGNDLTGNSVPHATLGSGGAVYISASTGTLDSNTLESNSSAYNAGALSMIQSSTVDLIDNIFRSNKATTAVSGKAGAVYVTDSTPDITGNLFEGNQASESGGALILQDTAANLVHNRFVANKATEKAAGVWLTSSTGSSASSTMTNNIFSGNEVTGTSGQGAAVHFNSKSGANVARGTFINNVVAENKAQSAGAGVYVGTDAAATVMNNIFYRNLVKDGLFVSTSSTTLPTVTYNDAYGNAINYGGKLATSIDASNLQVDPLFVSYSQDANYSNDDLHLQSSSQVRNAGNPGSSYNDPDGSRNDMGAYGGPLATW